ncbi:pyridoxal phosphate-dependent aminotransferase [Tepidibacillus infernus]|uniref:pyridoxal phosphate-dependent aminotransferase n=1 Tax=Tepidibacillus infernus TaxID=1806172 RepID=UPI003B70834B
MNNTPIKKINCFVGNWVAEIDWNKTLYFDLDKLFFDKPITADRNLLELSSGTNTLKPSNVYLDSLSEDAKNWRRFNYYTAPLGDQNVREAIRIFEDYVGGYIPNNFHIAVTNGAAEALRLSFNYLNKNGKKSTLILGPQYGIVYQIMNLAGFVFKEMIGDPENGFLPEPENIERELEKNQFDVIFMTQPNNPTGSLYNLEQFERIVSIAKKYSTSIVYEKIGSDIKYKSSVNVHSYGEIFKNLNYWDETIIIDSLSKRRAVSGLRVGYILGSNLLMKYIVETRFGDCPPLLSKDGIIKDFIYSSIIHLMEKNKNYKESCNMVLRKANDTFKVKFENILNADEIFEHKNNILQMYDTVYENKSYIEEKLKPWIDGYTILDSGTNYMLCLKVPFNNEETFAKDLFNKEVVTVYPFGCFIGDQELNKKIFIPQHFWVRVSCAVEKLLFKETVDRIANYLGGV